MTLGGKLFYQSLPCSLDLRTSCPKNRNFAGCFKKKKGMLRCPVPGDSMHSLCCGQQNLPSPVPQTAGLQSHETWLGTTGLGKKVIQDFQTITCIAQLLLK